MEADRTLVCGNANLLTAYIRAKLRPKCVVCLYTEVAKCGTS